MFLQSCHVVCLVLFSEIRQAGKGSCRQCVCLKRGNLRVTECDLWCCAWVYALYFYPSFSLESWLNCVGVKLPNSNPFLIISHFVTNSLPWHHYWRYTFWLFVCLYVSMVQSSISTYSRQPWHVEKKAEPAERLSLGSLTTARAPWISF